MGDEDTNKTPGAADILSAVSGGGAGDGGKPAKDPAPSKPNADKAPDGERFHVVGPGAVRFKGEHLLAGAEFTASPADVASLVASGNVAAGPSPKAPAPASGRKAGTYRWVGPGNLMHDRKVYEPGMTVDLDAKQARRMGERVVEA